MAHIMIGSMRMYYAEHDTPGAQVLADVPGRPLGVGLAPPNNLTALCGHVHGRV